MIFFENGPPRPPARPVPNVIIGLLALTSRPLASPRVPPYGPRRHPIAGPRWPRTVPIDRPLAWPLARSRASRSSHPSPSYFARASIYLGRAPTPETDRTAVGEVLLPRVILGFILCRRKATYARVLGLTRTYTYVYKDKKVLT